MRLKKCVLILSVSLCASGLRAQETNEVVQLKEQMQQMQKGFEKREQDMEARFEKKFTAQDAVIESLKEKLAVMPTSPPPLFVAGEAPAKIGRASCRER